MEIATAHVATGAMMLVVAVLSLLHIVKLIGLTSPSRIWIGVQKEALA
jgi:hypothetical protein